MSVQPLKLSREPEAKLVIEWSDGQRREYTFRELRDACPCATCRELRSAPPAAPNPFVILKPEETRPLNIDGMSPVGNYAYSISFSDGHDTGIFTLEFLHGLGRQI